MSGDVDNILADSAYTFQEHGTPYSHNRSHCHTINLAPSAFMGAAAVAAVAAAASYDHHRLTNATAYSSHPALENYHSYNPPTFVYSQGAHEIGHNSTFHYPINGTTDVGHSTSHSHSYPNHAYPAPYHQLQYERKSAFASVDANNTYSSYDVSQYYSADSSCNHNLRFTECLGTLPPAVSYADTCVTHSESQALQDLIPNNCNVGLENTTTATTRPTNIDPERNADVTYKGDGEDIHISTYPNISTYSSASTSPNLHSRQCNDTNLTVSTAYGSSYYNTPTVSCTAFQPGVTKLHTTVLEQSNSANACTPAGFSDCSVSPIPIDVTSVDHFGLGIVGDYELDNEVAREFDGYSACHSTAVHGRSVTYGCGSLASQTPLDVEAASPVGSISVGHSSPALSDDIDCTSDGQHKNQEHFSKHSIQMPRPVLASQNSTNQPEDNQSCIPPNDLPVASTSYGIPTNYHLYPNYFGYSSYNYLQWKSFTQRTISDPWGSSFEQHLPVASNVDTLPSISVLASQSAIDAPAATTSDNDVRPIPTFSYVSLPRHYELLHQQQMSASAASNRPDLMSQQRHNLNTDCRHKEFSSSGLYSHMPPVGGDYSSQQTVPTLTYQSSYSQFTNENPFTKPLTPNQDLGQSASHLHQPQTNQDYLNCLEPLNNCVSSSSYSLSYNEANTSYVRHIPTGDTVIASVCDANCTSTVATEEESQQFQFKLNKEYAGKGNLLNLPIVSDLCISNKCKKAKAIQPAVASHAVSNQNHSKSSSKKKKRKRRCDMPEKKSHDCQYCGKKFQYKTVLQNHERIHTGEKPFKCTMCAMAFSRATYLNNHMRTHTGERPYKCEQCDSAFIQKAHLLAHNRIHTGQKNYVCDVCKKRFRHAHNLKVHTAMHNGFKRYGCRESDCQVAFYTNTELKRHAAVHKMERVFLCSKCPKTFPSNIALRKHLPVHRVRLKSWRCSFCGEKFNEKCLLRKHKRTHQSLPKPYRCDLCKRSFAIKLTYEKHLTLPIHKRCVKIQQNKEKKANEIAELTAAVPISVAAHLKNLCNLSPAKC